MASEIEQELREISRHVRDMPTDARRRYFRQLGYYRHDIFATFDFDTDLDRRAFDEGRSEALAHAKVT